MTSRANRRDMGAEARAASLARRASAWLIALSLAMLPAGAGFAAWADDAPDASASAESNASETAESTEAPADASDAPAGASTDAASASSTSAEASAPAQETVALDSDDNLVDPTQRADNSFIYDTTIESLFSQASLYEGKTVQVIGEVIGDVVTGDAIGSRYCWITLTSTDSDNSATISVLLSVDQASQIDHLGRYGVTGTTLQVRGTYHQACSEHEGIPDIHATNSSVVARGVEEPDLLEFDDFLGGIVAVALGAALMGAYYFVRERSR